ncbi:MAG: hypothetical protein JRN21_05220 [Nitrososphaerota archaeon]|nr:hypothetical protein [Nitrososphaerota archaeon]
MDPNETPRPKVPVELEEEKVTVPVGELPVTVAVQVVSDPVEPEGAWVGSGEQETDVLDEVGRVLSGRTGAGAGVAPTAGSACCGVAAEERGVTLTGEPRALTTKSATKRNACILAGRRSFTSVIGAHQLFQAVGRVRRPSPEMGGRRHPFLPMAGANDGDDVAVSG